MKIPRDLSGRDVVNALCSHWGYRQIHQEGSHVILQTDMPSHQRISVPDHHPIRIGLFFGVRNTFVPAGSTCHFIADSVPSSRALSTGFGKMAG